MTRRIITAAIAGALIAGTALAAAPSASAKDGDHKSRGSCNTSSRWEAEAEREGGIIEVEFEVKTGQTGQNWRVVMRHDGVPVFRSTKATIRDDDDDSFPAQVKWKTTRPDHAGPDRFVFRAVNQQTGEICRTAISV